MDPKQQRPIKINVGAVKRLAKEKASYEAELADAQAKIDASTFPPASTEHRRLQNFREEAATTLQDVERRLEDFKGKLRAALGDLGDKFPDDPFVIEAKALLAS
jgi:hypothetical protein